MGPSGSGGDKLSAAWRVVNAQAKGKARRGWKKDGIGIRQQRGRFGGKSRLLGDRRAPKHQQFSRVFRRVFGWLFSAWNETQWAIGSRLVE